MKQRIPISIIMAKQLIKVSSSTKVSVVYQFFKDHAVKHLPVTEGSKLVGVISKSDIQQLASTFGNSNKEVIPSLLDSYQLDHVMVKNPLAISPNTTLKETVDILANESFHSLPVVEDGNLIGIATTNDILNYLLQQR